MNLHEIQYGPIIDQALREDWGFGDWTTDYCISAETLATAKIIAKEDLVVAGIDVAAAVFRRVDTKITIECFAADGQSTKNRALLMGLSGPARSLLKAERVALNIFARMCGIATTTRQFVDAIKGTGVQLLDTRKTTPGLRILEKAATAWGGSRNHRWSLDSGIIVKENHIRGAGSIFAAVQRIREQAPPGLKIEVETGTLGDVEEALKACADVIMLDNMDLATMKAAVAMIQKRALVEASGNVRLDNIRAIAETGVDFISTGATIHSAKWADLSLLFDV